MQSGVVAALAWSSNTGLLRTGVVEMVALVGGVCAVSGDTLVGVEIDGL